MGHRQRRHGHARRQTQDHRRPLALALRRPQASHRHRPLRLLGRDLPRARPPPRPTRAADASRRASADLHFRGFSASRIDPRANSPTRSSTPRSRPASFWNPTPGLYTRYGDVRPLLERCRRPLRHHGIRRRNDAPLRRPRRPARRLDPRLSPESRRLGQRPRPQHRLVHNGRRRCPSTP